MKVLFSSSECSPFVKVGGLADVVSSLPKSLAQLGVKVSIVIPFYEFLKLKTPPHLVEKNISLKFGQNETFDIWQTTLPNTKIPVYLIKNPKYFSGKEVYLSEDASSEGTQQEAARFLFLSQATIKLAEILNTDIIHCHDWITGIIPYLVKKEKKNFKTILTIHNLGYQGIYSPEIVNYFLHTNFSTKVNCLKLGIVNSNRVTTVSPTYAKEILIPKNGFGLSKYLSQRKNKLRGILNGLDTQTFNPQKDTFLKKQYSVKAIKNKKYNKVFLQKTYFKAIKPDTPIFALISRLTSQKGIYLVEKIIPQLMKQDVQFIVLGKGVKQHENFFVKTAKKFPKKFWIKIGFDEELAHQIYAGSDIFLMPSFYEPCGLGQLIAMNYGTIPVVRAVGGLKDTVQPVKMSSSIIRGTGFTFENFSSKTLWPTIEKVLSLYKDKKIWQQVQINGMKKDFSWKKSAREYLDLYSELYS